MNASILEGFEVSRDEADWRPRFGEAGDPSATVYFPGGSAKLGDLAAGQEQAGPGRYFLSGGSRYRSRSRSRSRSHSQKRKTQKRRKNKKKSQKKSRKSQKNSHKKSQKNKHH